MALDGFELIVADSGTGGSASGASHELESMSVDESAGRNAATPDDHGSSGSRSPDATISDTNMGSVDGRSMDAPPALCADPAVALPPDPSRAASSPAGTSPGGASSSSSSAAPGPAARDDDERCGA